MNNRLYFAGIILILISTSFIYSNHFNNEFHFDDSHTIQNNVYVRSINNIPLFFKDAGTFSNLPQNQSYRPVVSTSLAFDYWLGKGYNLFYFHLSSFILFLLQALLMFFFVFKIFSISDTGIKNDNSIFFAAALAVAFYMFHPANAETINYIIARSDLQSTFFVILAFVMYIFSAMSRKTFLYLIPVGIGALAKPTAVMFAPLFLFYIILFEEKLSIANLFQKAYFHRLTKIIKKTFPAFLFCSLMYLVIDKMTPATWTPGGSSVLSYLITQPFVIAHYFGIFFIPAGLSADTDWGLLKNIWDIRFLTGVSFIAIMTYTAVYCSSKTILRPVSYGIIWFFLSLLPTSSVIPFSEVLNYHRVFIPFIGLTIGASWLLNLLSNRYLNTYGDRSLKFGTTVIVLCLLSCYGYNTYERNKIWRTEESLWYDVTVKSPKNGRGLMNYGLVKMASGDYGTADKYFTEAFKILPYYSSLYINMGILKNATGDKIAAEQYLKQGLIYGANYPDSWVFYARFLCNWSRYAEAIPMLIKALELSPAYLNARLLLMKSYNETAQWDKLNTLVRQTLLIDPENTEILKYNVTATNRRNNIEVFLGDVKKLPAANKYLELSLQYYNTGNYQKCIEAAGLAIKLQPNYAEAYNNLGAAYNRMYEYDKAITMFRKALTIKGSLLLASNNLIIATNNRNRIEQAESTALKNSSADNYLSLSLVYYNLGMYKKCIAACNDALQLKPDYAAAYNNICSSYNRLEEWDLAIAAGEKGLKINSDNSLIRNNLTESRQKKIARKNF